MRAAAEARLAKLQSAALDRVERELVDGPQGAKVALRIVEAAGLLERRSCADAPPITPDEVVDQLARRSMPDPFEDLIDMVAAPNARQIEAAWEELEEEFRTHSQP